MKLDDHGKPIMRDGVVDMLGGVHGIDASTITTYMKEHSGCGEIAIAKCTLLGIEFKYTCVGGDDWFEVTGPWHRGTGRASKERAAVEVCLIYDIPMEVTSDETI